MNKVGKKLVSFFKEKGITQEEIAKELGVSQAYINSLLNDKKAFGKKQALKWEEVFGLSSIWLLTGEGEMLRSNVKQEGSNNNNQVGNNISYNADEVIKELIALSKKKDEQISKRDEQIDKLIAHITSQIEK